MKNQSELDILQEQLQTAESVYKFFESSSYDTLYTTYGVTRENAKWMSMVPMESIDTLTYDDANRIAQDSGLNLDTLKNKQKKNFQLNISFLDYFKEVVKEVKKVVNEIENQRTGYESLKSDVTKMKSDYIDYVKSEEFKKKKEENRKKIHDQILSMEDGPEKKELEEKLEVINNLETCRFILHRIETYGEKEKDSIKRTFFSEREGSVLMQKFRAKCKQFDIDPRIYQYLLNIEEICLPEEYYPFNNLFLFVVMRYLSYADRYNKVDRMYVQKILNNMMMLIHHSFPSQADEDDFVSLIKECVDHFLSDRDKFIDDNTTHRHHPSRQQAENAAEQRKKELLLKAAKLRGIDMNPELDSITMSTILEQAIDEENAKMNSNEDMVTSGFVETDSTPFDEIVDIVTNSESIKEGFNDTTTEEKSEPLNKNFPIDSSKITKTGYYEIKPGQKAEAPVFKSSTGLPYIVDEDTKDGDSIGVSENGNPLIHIDGIDMPVEVDGTIAEGENSNVIDIDADSIFGDGMIIEPVIPEEKEHTVKIGTGNIFNEVK
nr:MAG TPA: hypothetical protein [Caudoviricetes sp.]